MRRTYKPVRKPKYEKTLGPFYASGDRKADVEADLMRQAATALEGQYTPMMLHAQGRDGEMAVIWRDPKSDWCYSVFDADRLEYAAEAYVTSSGYATRTEARDVAAWDIATRAWKPVDGLRVPAIIREYTRDPRYNRESFIRWAQWQLWARYAVDMGMTPADAHVYANAREWKDVRTLADVLAKYGLTPEGE